MREAEGDVPGKLPNPGECLEFDGAAGRETMQAVLRFGGFPEPFLAQSERKLRRWRLARLDRFFREDVRDLDAVRDLGAIEVLADMIGERVGSPLSLNALREDLEVSHRAVSHWADVLERLYFLHRVRPFSSRKIRGLKKRAKAYLWDYTGVEGRGPRFENLVANHLLKFCHALRDREGYDVNLAYIRDSAGREVDFLVTAGKRPWFAVEAKAGGTAIDRSLHHFKKKLGIPQVFQVVLDTDRDFERSGVRFLPARLFLNGLV